MSEQQKKVPSTTTAETEEQNCLSKSRIKVTFYLTYEQRQKLDSLVYEHNRIARGKRINQNDIVRYLIDQCDSNILENIKDHKPIL